jgi:hypothetical protein
MRPGNQNNKRIRGRGGRKGPNPLSRTYESNGPDVKIRGTAHHVAEKYQQLARDAAAAGDRVISENYYQHAEHYLRIIASAQQSMQQPVVLPRGDEAEDEAEAQTERAERQDRQDRRDRGDRGDRGERNERGDRGERNERGDRGDRDTAKSDDGAKSVMPVDAPQPFVENMPVLNAKSAGAGDGPGAAKAKDEDAGDSGDDDDDRGRRRTRGTRGRGLRKARNPGQGDEASAKDGDTDDAPAANGTADAAGSDAGEPEAQPKPRARRTPRPRTPKAAATDEKSETPATNDA